MLRFCHIDSPGSISDVPQPGPLCSVLVPLVPCEVQDLRIPLWCFTVGPVSQVAERCSSRAVQPCTVPGCCQSHPFPLPLCLNPSTKEQQVTSAQPDWVCVSYRSPRLCPGWKTPTISSGPKSKAQDADAGPGRWG